MIKISTFVVGAALGLATIAHGQSLATHASSLTDPATAATVVVASNETRLPGQLGRTEWFDRAIDDILTGRTVATGAEGRGIVGRNSL